MADIKSIGGNPIVLDADGIAAGAVTPDKLAAGAAFDAITTGAAIGITGDGPTDSATWLQRVSTSDGPTTIRSIHGHTGTWNQLVHNGDFASASGWTGENCTISASDNVGTVTVGSGSATPDIKRTDITLENNHVYYMSVEVNPTETMAAVALTISSTSYVARMENVPAGWHRVSGVVTTGTSSLVNRTQLYLNYGDSTNTGKTVGVRNYMVIDLTALYGAGSEPSTIEEFEALYPEPYYPYDAGSLLQVNMEGVETVGANLWGGDAMKDAFLELASSVVEGTNEYGDYIRWPASAGSGSPAVFKGPFKPNTAYTLILSIGKTNDSTSTNLKVTYTDGTTGNIGRYATTSDGSPEVLVFVTNASKSLYAINAMNSSGSSYLYYDGSGVFEGVRTADEYEPYWKAQRLIDAATYFPDGMRSAGTVYDELTETQAITRVGSVDLGTLTWAYNANGYMYASGLTPAAETVATQYVVPNATCVPYEMRGNIYVTNPSVAVDKTISINGGTEVRVRDSAYTDAATFKAAMSGVMLHYALATPTTAEIDPPLNLTYRTAAGGTERVMVPTGEQSAPPTIVTVQGYTAESLRDAALANIAPVENGLASTNYAVGSYLVHDGQLCKVTTAIATGETITIGTNVTTTTVMAEILSLVQ